MLRKESTSFWLSGCGSLILVFLIFYVPIVLWTDRNLDFYCSLLANKPVDIPIWISCLASICEPIFFLDLIGEIIRACL